MCGVVESCLACQMPDPGSLPRIDDSVPSRVRVKSRILYALSINRDIDPFKGFDPLSKERRIERIAVKH